MERQPDSLQPDDEDQLEAASGEGREEARDVAGREHPDAKELETEHRIGHPPFDGDEDAQKGEPAGDFPDHPRVAPTHGRAAVRLNRVCEADENERKPDGEEHVARNVETLVGADRRRLVEHEISPHGTE